MDPKQLRQRIARLESINDLLVSELDNLDDLMRLIGFNGGLDAVKAAAHQIILKSQINGTATDFRQLSDSKIKDNKSKESKSNKDINKTPDKKFK